MKQIIQYQKTGELSVADVPPPRIKDGFVLVQNVFSVISSGTERTSVETAQASVLGKAKSRPDLVKQVMDNLKREGVMATYEKVKSRLDSYKELGYSCAGIVAESGCDEFKAGDRVACAGAGANHSEFVLVPKNLCARIPEGVDFDEAAFATIGAIALQGVRQADLRIGENAVVTGLGLIGLITVQILKASGCRVAGIDVANDNFKLAEELGCDVCCEAGGDSLSVIESFSNGYGTDAVIITAGTKSNEPVEYAVKYVRKRGKIVVVGAVGMNIPRAGFYEKEIDFRISCSYGPGRYDKDYEERGIDYPYGYVRWTEKRNMEAVMELMKSNNENEPAPLLPHQSLRAGFKNARLNVRRLITHIFPIEEGLKAYDIITGKRNEKHLAVLISYNPENQEILHPESEDYSENGKEILTTGQTEDTADKILNEKQISLSADYNGIKLINKVVIGFIGAGNFAQSYLLPNLKNTRLKTVVTESGVGALGVKNKFRFEGCDTDARKVIDDSEINAVFIATRHDSHSKFASEALRAGKHVFVEKPIAINEKQLSAISESLSADSGKHPLNTRNYLQAGFNRRFSKPFAEIKKFFEKSGEPFVINYRVHAGFIPQTHWIQSPEQGGRIIGEACHFIDTMQFLTGAEPVRVFAESVSTENTAAGNFDNVAVIINFSNGSVGNLLYLANGDSSVSKERCEVFSGGRTAVMHNFESVEFHANNKMSFRKFDGRKGHKEEVKHFLDVITGRTKPVLSFRSIWLTTTATFKIVESLKKRKPQNIN